MKKINKLLSLILVLITTVSIFTSVPFTANAATQAEQVIAVAKSKVGSYGRPNMFTNWMGSPNADWCAGFACWSAEQAGVSKEVVPNIFSSTALLVWYNQRGRWHRKNNADWYYNGRSDSSQVDSSYIPQVGDLILLNTNSSYSDGPDHTGLVTGYSNGVVYTIEGNVSGNQVKERSYSASDYSIFGYCNPAYTGTSYTPVDIGTNFDALILNTAHWKPIENKNGNVTLATEDRTRKQIWHFERQSDNSYIISSLYDSNVIDLDNYGNADGTNIKVCPGNNTDAQRWYIIKNDKGEVSFIPKCSQNGAMDLDGNNDKDGTNIHFWTYHGNNAQRFSVYQITSVPQYLSYNFGDKFDGVIYNAPYNKPIENMNKNVVLGTENKKIEQIWHFERQSDNSYKISSSYDDAVMDLDNYGNTDGTNIKVCASNDTDAQRWYIVKNEKGNLSFVPKCSQNGAMDLDGNNNKAGTNIHFWTYHGNDAQQYSITIIKDINKYLELLVGDVDEDNNINILDATLIQKYISEVLRFTNKQKLLADVNGDGEINIDDITKIQKMIASFE